MIKELSTKEQAILAWAIDCQKAENAFYDLLADGQTIQRAGALAGFIPDKFVYIAGKRGPIFKEETSV